MEKIISDLKKAVVECGAGPMLEEMEHNTLLDKGIAGPTAAHRIEEVHTPLNFAYMTFSTGSTAFQNVVGVTFQELPERIKAGVKALKLAAVPYGGKLLVTYPPLVNVFPKGALDEMQISVEFIIRPSRKLLWVKVAE